MATKVLVNDSLNDWGTAANWDPSGAPTTGDTIKFVKADKELVITSNVDHASNGIEYADIHFEGFVGQIGGPGSPLEMGNVGGSSTVIFDAPECKGFHFDGDASLFSVLNTRPDPQVVTIQGGTIDQLIHAGGIGLYLTNGGTYTLIEVDGPTAEHTIQNGNTVTTLRCFDGRSLCFTQATNVYVHDGEVVLLGETKTYAVAEVHGARGRLLIRCPDSTISSLKGYRGLIDGRHAVENTITITAGELRRAATMLFGSHIVDGTGITNYGGTYRGYGDPTRTLPVSSGGSGV